MKGSSLNLLKSTVSTFEWTVWQTTKNSEWTFTELRFEPVSSQLRIRRAKNLNCACVYTAHTHVQYWNCLLGFGQKRRLNVVRRVCRLIVPTAPYTDINFLLFLPIFVTWKICMCLSRCEVLWASHPCCPLSLPLFALSLSIRTGVTSHSAIGVVMHQPPSPHTTTLIKSEFFPPSRRHICNTRYLATLRKC